MFGHENYAVCCRFVGTTKKFIVIIFAFYVGLVVVSVCFPLLAYALLGRLVTPTQNAIPGLDRDDLWQFAIVAFIDDLLMLCACFICSASDCLFFTVFFNMPMVATVIANSMNSGLQRILHVENASSRDIHKHFVQIAEFYRTYAE